MVNLKNKKILLPIMLVILLASSVISYYFLVLKPNKKFEAETLLIIKDYNKEIDGLNKRFEKELLFRGDDAEKAKIKAEDFEKRADSLNEPSSKNLKYIRVTLLKVLICYNDYLQASIAAEEVLLKDIEGRRYVPDAIFLKFDRFKEDKITKRGVYIKAHKSLTEEVETIYGFDLEQVNFDRKLNKEECNLLISEAAWGRNGDFSRALFLSESCN